MLTDAQLALRREGLTATDMVILAGCSRFATPLDVYESKLGAPTKAMTLAMEMGHAAEDVIVRHVARHYGLTVAPGETRRHNLMDWVIATPDRFVLDEKKQPVAVIECKLVGWRQVREWYASVANDNEEEDDDDPDENALLVFPDSVAVQATWQMGTTGVRHGYIGALLGGWADDDFHHATIERNDQLWWGLLELGERFWVDHVLARRPPAPDDSDKARRALERIYPTIQRRELAPATLDASKLALQYLEANERVKQAVAEKRAAGNALRALIGDTEGVRGDVWKATWIERKGKISVGRIAEELNLSPADLEKWRGPNGRTLRVSKLSKKELKQNAA